MPTGTGSFNIRNLPNTDYVIDPVLFNQLTSREFFNPPSVAIPAFGSYAKFSLPQTGIIGAINVHVVGTITTTGGTVTVAPTSLYPWDLLGFVLSGNGQNNFISCDGLDLRIRELVANRAFVDGVSTWPVAGASPFIAAAAVNFVLDYRIPIAMDDTTLVGALYAQSEATNLTIQLNVRAVSDLFNITAGSLAITGNIYFEEEIYDIPYNPNKSSQLVIPDLSVLHGIISNEIAVSSASVVDSPLPRINGDMQRLIWYTIDKTTATIALTTTAKYNYSALLYGANKTPYMFNPQAFLYRRNNRDARVILPDGQYVLDFTADNPARDRVILEGVTNLKLRTSYSTVPTGGSVVHFAEETLFA